MKTAQAILTVALVVAAAEAALNCEWATSKCAVIGCDGEAAVALMDSWEVKANAKDKTACSYMATDSPDATSTADCEKEATVCTAYSAEIADETHVLCAQKEVSSADTKCAVGEVICSVLNNTECNAAIDIPFLWTPALKCEWGTSTSKCAVIGCDGEAAVALMDSWEVKANAKDKTACSYMATDSPGATSTADCEKEATVCTAYSAEIGAETLVFCAQKEVSSADTKCAAVEVFCNDLNNTECNAATLPLFITASGAAGYRAPLMVLVASAALLWSFL